MPAIPDLAGQPAWVVVVVSVLFVVGSVGTAWLRRGKPEAEEDPEGETARPVESGAVPSLTTGSGDHATLVIQKALDHLASEAQESREARAETATLRRELESVRAELLRRTADLEAAVGHLARCEARAELLAERAQRHEGGNP